MAKEVIHASRTGTTRNPELVTRCNRVVPKARVVGELAKATCGLCLRTATKQEKLALCSGCEENFYNGNNPYNVKECWHLAKALIAQRKRVGIDDVPPWKYQPVIAVLTCRHEKGNVLVAPNRER